MKLHLRLAKASLRTLAWSLILLAGGILALLRTALGHEVLLGWIVDQADARVAGRIAVEGIRSGNILRGGRLLGLELRTPEGQRFLRADSVEMTYTVRGLIRGDLTFRQVRVWGLEMDLLWSLEQEGSTLSRWMGSSETESPAPGAGSEGRRAGGGPRLQLEDLEVVGADFRLRRPTGLDPDGMVRVLPNEGGTLALDVAMDRLRVPRVTAGGGGSEGTRISVASGTGRVDILRETIPIREVAVEIRVADGELNARVEALQIPQGRARGDLTVYLRDDSRRRVSMELDVDDLDGEALGPIVAWAPPFTGSTRLEGVVDRVGSTWYFQGLRADWAGGDVQGSGTVRIQDGVRLQAVDLRVAELPLDAVSRYVPLAEDKPGVLSGNLRLEGPVDAVGVLGRLGLRSRSGALSTADVSGTLLRADDGVAFSDTEIFFSPLSYPSLDPWIPALPVAGTGTARLVLNGSVQQGLRMDFDLTHRGSRGGVSRLLGQGSFRQVQGDWRVDVQGDAAPFELAALLDRHPGLPVRGAASGSFRVAGPLDSLGLRLEVEGTEGRLALTGALNPQDLTRTIQVEGDAEAFQLGAFLVPAGDRTELTGQLRARAAGRGAGMVGEGFVRLADSRIRGIAVDSIRVDTRILDGALVLDTARATVGGLEFDGGGTLTLPGVDRPRGAMELRVRADSLMGIRPAFLGDVVHARDTLEGIERDVLILEGVDPDTLPLASEVTLAGSGRGRISLLGSLDDFQGTGELVLDSLGYGGYRVAGARLDVTGRDLPGEAASLELALDTDSLRALDRTLASSRVRAVLRRDGARASIRLVRNDAEEYLLAGGVDVEGSTYRVDLDQLDLRFDSLHYALTAPARLAWSDSVLVVDQLELLRGGQDEVRISASGVLPQRGEADFRTRIEGARLERLIQVLQITDRELEGRVDLELLVQGAAASPRVQGEFRTRELVVGQFDADSTAFALDYRDREARVEARAWKGGRIFVEADGTVPVDLALQPGVDRYLDDPMDVRARVDEVEVAPFLALLENLEDVEGLVSGDFTVRGTVDEPVPEGLVRLENGSWTVGSLGVRQTNVQGTFTLTPDRSVAVNAQATSGGRLDLSGEVRLEPVGDPELDLELRFQGFQAVDRRDVTGALTGTLQLQGRYRSPRVQGFLTVDRGVLFLEEFQRAVGVVDLTDPLFLGLVEGADIAIPVDRPLLEGIRNPFLDALRVQVDLTVPRGTWLRSGDMNVEIGGELDLAYDRPQRDLVLVGELLARRGQYTVLGRTFEVQGGTVSFIGIPGINPLLDIQAVAPIRRQDGGTLEIQASVQGSLVDPRVTLSTDEQGYAQSDLVSFLVLGRPSTEITGPATGSTTGQLQGTLVSGAANFGLGTLASQLGSIALQRTNFVDYLSVSQTGGVGVTAAGDLATSFSSTQLELGWYLGGGDVFAVLVLRPLAGLGTTGSSSTRELGGVRLEWQSSDEFHWEAFMEDRFLRRNAFGLSQLGLEGDYSYGLAFFREWGY